MIEISNSDARVLREKVPELLRRLRLRGDDRRGINAARMVEGVVRRMNNAARKNRQKQRPT